MGRRKLRIYGDADLDSDLEAHLRGHNWINYVGTKEHGLSDRGDDHHYQMARKDGRVLLTHDDGYLNNRVFPMLETDGVIVLKRGAGLDHVAIAFERLLRWYWGPVLRKSRGTLGYMKINLSRDGFHYWGRTYEGQDEEGYQRF
jgi:hypothetical protein